MQVKLSCWKSGLNTLLVELLPWALLANYSQWDLWLFEGETIVLQIPAGKVIVPPNFKVGCQLQCMYPARDRLWKEQSKSMLRSFSSKFKKTLDPTLCYFIASFLRLPLPDTCPHSFINCMPLVCSIGFLFKTCSLHAQIKIITVIFSEFKNLPPQPERSVNNFFTG